MQESANGRLLADMFLVTTSPGAPTRWSLMQVERSRGGSWLEEFRGQPLLNDKNLAVRLDDRSDHTALEPGSDSTPLQQ